MTIKKAIERTKQEVTKNTEWNTHYQMWEQQVKPAGMDTVAWMKARKLAYASELLDYDYNEAWDFALQPGGWVELLYDFIRREHAYTQRTR